MRKLWNLWDRKLRKFIILSFAGFLLLLMFKHENVQYEIMRREAQMKLYIRDSVTYDIGNGVTLTIYKKDEKDSDTAANTDSKSN